MIWTNTHLMPALVTLQMTRILFYQNFLTGPATVPSIPLPVRFEFDSFEDTVSPLQRLLETESQTG